MDQRDSGRYLVVSTDSHAGADLRDYKPYLAQRWHGEFDAWADKYENPWELLGFGDDVTVKGAPDLEMNWNSQARIKANDKEGIAGEILFPNTVPPFFPSWSLFGDIPSPENYERRLAGIRAHNRWLEDFCGSAPGRRWGVAQIFLNNIEDALADIRWARDHGMCAVLIGSVPPGHPTVRQLWHESYEPVWALCEEINIPVAIHLASGAPDNFDPCDARARASVLPEMQFYCFRSLTALVFGGVFERHPSLKVVFTETGAAWVPKMLAELDGYWMIGHTTHNTPAGYMHEAVQSLPLRPSEYFGRNCYIGSFLGVEEVKIRAAIGAERLMWASDLPHDEGCYPYTRESIRFTMADVPEDECRQILGLNAIRVYGLAYEPLRKVADRIGPTVDEVGEPLEALPDSPRVQRSIAAFRLAS